MSEKYDYIIIGSGFGGSVSALRLSEKGYKVLVIEKGKWYQPQDFAKTNWNLKRWLWLPLFRFFGIMKLTIFRHVSIVSGTGVGGGSLVYANTLPVPKTNFYKSGSWAKLNDWENQLKPFYNTALEMLGAAPNPKLFDGDKALQQLAVNMGRAEHFEHPKVAVFFGEQNKEVDDPYFEGKGPKRSGCNFCGGCMTGCRYNAKNTLDKNYLHLAQQHGAEILAEHEVVDVLPNSHAGEEGYAVSMKQSTRYFARKKTLQTKGVIFSGGVLGTIKLLLKLKRKSLPNLSEKLGMDIRTNNETLTSVSTLDKDKDFSQGVAIGSLLHTDDNSHLEIVRYSKGSNFWKMLHVPFGVGSNVFVRFFNSFVQFISSPFQYLKIYWFKDWSQSTAVLLFMQTVDSTLRFKRNFLGLMSSGVTKGKKPTPNIPESIALTKQYAELVNGKPTNFALETIAGISSTAHILGGAVMGENANEGVIDKSNHVFGYENMLVIDGAMISANPGVNPSLSITAIAEHAMHQIKHKENS